MAERRNPIRLDKRITLAEAEKRRREPFSHRVIDAIDEAIVLYPETRDWLVAKKAIMLHLPIRDKQLFSTRDQLTKRHHEYNEFEQNIRRRWYKLTGNVLVMPEDKMLPSVPRDRYLSLDVVDEE